MNTPTQENNVVHMSANLLAKARHVADEEHRPADKLVNDALRSAGHTFTAMPVPSSSVVAHHMPFLKPPLTC